MNPFGSLQRSTNDGICWFNALWGIACVGGLLLQTAFWFKDRYSLSDEFTHRLFAGFIIAIPVVWLCCIIAQPNYRALREMWKLFFNEPPMEFDDDEADAYIGLTHDLFGKIVKSRKSRRSIPVLCVGLGLKAKMLMEIPAFLTDLSDRRLDPLIFEVGAKGPFRETDLESLVEDISLLNEDLKSYTESYKKEIELIGQINDKGRHYKARMASIESSFQQSIDLVSDELKTIGHHVLTEDANGDPPLRQAVAALDAAMGYLDELIFMMDEAWGTCKDKADALFSQNYRA